MRQLNWAGAWIAPVFLIKTNAFTKPCIYQAEKCGFTMISAYGYNLTELTTAVNKTPSIPPLTADQIPQVIFRCEDIHGNLTGNSYCINGCLGALDLVMNDQCAVGGNGTCPPGNGTVTITTTSTTTTTTTVSGSGQVSCFRQCQTWCFGNNASWIAPTNIPQTMPAIF